MAKIIRLQNSGLSKNNSNHKEGFNNILHWASEMNNLLQMIEKSLENSPKYTPKHDKKDINSRG